MRLWILSALLIGPGPESWSAALYKLHVLSRSDNSKTRNVTRWFQLSHGLSHLTPFSDGHLITFLATVLHPRSSLFVHPFPPWHNFIPWLETGFLRLIRRYLCTMTSTSWTLDNTIGALLIGVIFAIFLFGIITLQTHLYFRRFAASDPWKLKVLVGFIRVKIPLFHE